MEMMNRYVLLVQDISKYTNTCEICDSGSLLLASNDHTHNLKFYRLQGVHDINFVQRASFVQGRADRFKADNVHQ